MPQQKLWFKQSDPRRIKVNRNMLAAIAYHRSGMLKANATEPYIHEDYKFHEDKCDELLDELLEDCPEIADNVKKYFLEEVEYSVNSNIRLLSRIIDNEIHYNISRLSGLQAEIFWSLEEIDEMNSKTDEIAEWFVNNASAVAHNNYWS
jgi:hypothetical protein